MRYPATHKQETRQRLIREAGALAKKAGFATSGVDALMATIGLTGAAFYAHFASKPNLLGEIMAAEIEATRARFENISQEAGSNALSTIIESYLSMAQVANPQTGCALPALLAEVARSDETVKAKTQAGITALRLELRNKLPDDETAWALLSMMIGGVALARALESSELQAEVVDACAKVGRTLAS